MTQIPKSYQIFYCELQENGKWWHSKQPIKVLIDKDKASKIFELLKKNASIYQGYIMLEIDHIENKVLRTNTTPGVELQN